MWLYFSDKNPWIIGLQMLLNTAITKAVSSEMAKHIAECLEQFNTGLDKVLQARQLVSLQSMCVLQKVRLVSSISDSGKSYGLLKCLIDSRL